MRSRHHGRLFWRFYRHGALVLLATTLLLSGVAWYFREQSPFARSPERLAAALQRELGGDLADPARLESRLADFADLMNMDVAVYRRDGRPLGRVGVDPPEALAADDAAALQQPQAVGFGHVYGAPLGPEAYLVSRWRGHPKGPIFPWAVGGVLGLLALLSWPAARRAARPLEGIAATVRALGEGDWSARTGLSRPDEIGYLARTIDEMAERIAHARAREQALLADVSHELRTPLARIRVGLEWAEEEGALPPPLAGLGQDVAELEALIEDILAAARLDQEEGGFVLRPAALAVETVVEEARGRFARRHPEATLAIEAQAGTVAGDARLLGRVLANLLDNGVRHGGGELLLRATPAEAGWRFAVLDRGPGVDEADLPRLFDAFFRADASRARATGGTGLGLTLCRRIVDAHGGRVEARPRPGGGLEIGFTLPG
ncbi:MAG: HAMP domain-containing sensor histidine kinase [bacterium]